MIQACIVRNRPRPVGSGGRCHQGNGQYHPGFDSGLRSNPVCLAGIAAVREPVAKGALGRTFYSFPAVRRIATLSARAVRAARTGAAAVRTDGTCGNGERAVLLPPGLRELFGYPGTSGAGNPGRL